MHFLLFNNTHFIWLDTLTMHQTFFYKPKHYFILFLAIKHL